MSITAISSLSGATGGKGALPGLGETLPGASQAFDFAALLAEQIPVANLAGMASQITTPPPVGPLETALLSDTIAKDKPLLTSPDNGEGTADILATLAASSKQAAETGDKKACDDKEQKAATDAETVPTDPGQFAQYAAPAITQPLQNRLPQSVNLDKFSPSGQIAKTSSTVISAKDARPDLSDQARPVTADSASPPLPTATQQASSFADSRVIQRLDTANTAILAGDATTGNSGNPPAFATALAATGTATLAPQALPPTVTTALDTPNWQHDFGTRVVWLAKNDQQVAQININPPQLGPVQISISLNGDQASATFASPHAEVRQAIQDSLPQLRELFSTAGISLGQANVGTQLPSQNREASYQFANEARSSRENAILSPDSHASSASAGIPIQRGRGLVDLFA